MLILPPGHAQTVRAKRQLTRREKRALAVVLAVVAALVVVIIVSLSVGGRSSGNGCIYVTIPGAVGAQEVNGCGAAARSICQSVATPGAYAPQSAQSIAAECRKAGLPVPAHVP